MKFLSPLPIEECRAVLREQIGARSSLLRPRFRRRTSRVIGDFNGEDVVLESSTHRFGEQFVGRLTASPEGTVLEGEWRHAFRPAALRKLMSVEHEILLFLALWAHFKKISD